ncbi:hypothetical protein BEI59_25110 [Eisenbergiella tayi]|uniref:Uncharacterized protein n=1 Tax=Eisenbergiella tayi TaxID=1432052 RepID=A0A1E3UB59_9FIRM|nr:hypothetical protein BEI59_25110 [Eisenbergiella tayi]ODR46606.1 hypothetical protein BEI63_27870 [Eisenbergiella tayi]
MLNLLSHKKYILLRSILLVFRGICPANPLIFSKNSYSSAFSRRLCQSRSPCRPPFPSPPDLALPCGAAPCKDSCKGRYKRAGP